MGENAHIFLCINKDFQFRLKDIAKCYEKSKQI